MACRPGDTARGLLVGSRRVGSRVWAWWCPNGPGRFWPFLSSPGLAPATPEVSAQFRGSEGLAYGIPLQSLPSVIKEITSCRDCRWNGFFLFVAAMRLKVLYVKKRQKDDLYKRVNRKMSKFHCSLVLEIKVYRKC